MLISIGEAALMLGVSVSTLRRWENEGRLFPVCRTKGNHRRYETLELQKLIYGDEEQKKLTIIYGRVSGHDQKDDLKRQIDRLENYCQKQEWKFEIISDLGSGLNYKKKGLKKLIHLIVNNKINRLVLTHKDRLLRFGSELIFALCKQFSVEIVILDDKVIETFEEELANDVITIITVFSAKLYGKRSHKNRKLNKETKLAA